VAEKGTNPLFQKFLQSFMGAASPPVLFHALTQTIFDFDNRCQWPHGLVPLVATYGSRPKSPLTTFTSLFRSLSIVHTTVFLVTYNVIRFQQPFFERKPISLVRKTVA
jgi:hypothetical protein